MTIRFFSRNRSVNRIGYGVSAATPATAIASGFSPSPHPEGGTNHFLPGGNTGSISFNLAGANPATIFYLPSRNKQVSLQTYTTLAADVFLVGGGGRGGYAYDLGTSGGGGGGGVVYRPAISIDTSLTYPVVAGSAESPSNFGNGTPAYIVAIRGGNGADRGETGGGNPGGSGGAYWNGNGPPGTGFQPTFPNPFGTPSNSNTYGYGNPSSGYGGGSSPFTVPAPLRSGTPVEPQPATNFGQGRGTGSSGGGSSPPNTGNGGNGSNPPGNNHHTPGSSGCVIVRIY